MGVDGVGRAGGGGRAGGVSDETRRRAGARARATNESASERASERASEWGMVVSSASAAAAATRVVTGDVIAERGIAGAGAYVDGAGRVRASACGEATTVGEGEGAVSSVRTAAGEAVVPRIGDDVYGRVTRVGEKAASVAVAVVNGRAPADGAFVGTIRRQDARAHAVDSVVMDECFREGDVVRAEVLSLGDSRSFYLTTAKDELGVVRATHRESRKTMLPISWTEVQCPVTGEVEDRKVARVDE